MENNTVNLTDKSLSSDLNIISETKDFLVIDKPAFLIVNRSETTNNQITLQDLIDAKNLIDKNDQDQEFTKRSGIVHRLDKETSGVIIVAKNSNSFRSLQQQFKERKVKKSYVALVHGLLKPEEGEISVPVGRLPWNRKRFGVLSDGRPAVTNYKVISEYQNNKKEEFSLVRLFPKTGRTHQIRVHLKYINHPIFSDYIYAGRKTAREDRKILSRVFLHSEEISINDPSSGESLTFKSGLPSELSDFLEKLELKKDN